MSRTNELVLNSGLPFGQLKGKVSQICNFLELFSISKTVWLFGHFLADLMLKKNPSKMYNFF